MGLWRSIRKNAALLTVSSLVMQSLSMLWQVWLAAHIGPAGIGLFQLIGSVGFLFITLAVSGIRFSVTRLLAEELGQCRGDLSAVCAALSASGTAAEIALSLALAALYLADRKRFCPAGECGAALTPRMLRIALPLASSAYARSALNTFRQLLVPRGLRLSGLSSESALAGYGVINGMAMPVLLLPTCLPLSVAELLVPALTEMQVAGERVRVRRSVREMLGKTFLLSLGAAAAFFVFARPLGMLLYGSAEAARFLRLLAPMVPFLYTDIVTDGCLKGLGQMMASMAFNIAEAALGLVLVWALLPRWALTGYLVTLYICEVFNFTLSLLRLRKVVKA